MSGIKVVSLSVLALVTLAGALWGVGGFENLDGQKNSIVSSQTASTKVIYACPMHPSETANSAGEKCRICGMNLRPVNSGAMNKGLGTTGGCSDCGSH